MTHSLIESLCVKWSLCGVALHACREDSCENVPDPVQNFLAIAIFVADGAYNFVKIGILSLEVRSLLPATPDIPLQRLLCMPRSEVGRDEQSGG